MKLEWLKEMHSSGITGFVCVETSQHANYDDDADTDTVCRVIMIHHSLRLTKLRISQLLLFFTTI